jgi:redox-sensitive bicupin YhaK (pirin superfamily)
MIRIRRRHERGRFRNQWLDARFSFNFGAWREPGNDGYSDLLVLNDDIVAPGGGFAEHGHEDMEVMSYPLEGAVEHRDSLGNVAIMRPGDVHLMRAGRGIRHSEMNASATVPERHLQWWILPAVNGLESAYQRLHVSADEKRNRWRLLASPDAVPGALHIAQDARAFAASIEGAALTHAPAASRRAYLHVIAGALALGPHRLQAGDAAFVEGEPVTVTNAAAAPAEALLFDLR